MLKGLIHGEYVLGRHGCELYAHAVIVDVQGEICHIGYRYGEMVLLKHIHDVRLGEHEHYLEAQWQLLSSYNIIYSKKPLPNKVEALYSL